MHRSFTLIFFTLLAFLTSAGLAQSSSINAISINSLTREIRDQQGIVAGEPGKSDSAAWLKLAVLLQDAAQYADAEPAYRNAIRLLNPSDRAAFADAADHLEIGEYAKAEPLEQQAISIRESLQDKLGTGISHMHLAVLLLGKRDLAAAEAQATSAVSLLVPGQSHAVASIPTDPAVANLVPKTEATPEQQMAALTNLSLVKCARDSCVGALPYLRQALEIAHANYPATTLPVGYLEFLQGYALWKSGDPHSAAPFMEKGTQILTAQLGWGHPTYIQAMNQYRAFLAEQGHTTEAKEIAAKLTSLQPK
jgi:tetratricopeptide (TPR) repeat protein